MKSTEVFKSTIKAYLDSRASEDELFAVSYTKENKNIDECVSYILNAVKESGCNGFAKEEIYSMAVHYYDEDDIKVGELPPNCRIAVDHVVELTDEDKRQAREYAIANYGREFIASQKKKGEKPKVEPIAKQASFFD